MLVKAFSIRKEGRVLIFDLTNDKRERVHIRFTPQQLFLLIQQAILLLCVR